MPNQVFNMTYKSKRNRNDFYKYQYQTCKRYLFAKSTKCNHKPGESVAENERETPSEQLSFYNPVLFSHKACKVAQPK